MILDAFNRQNAHAALRRLTNWNDLAIDRALRERHEQALRAGAVIMVTSSGVAFICPAAPRRAS